MNRRQFVQGVLIGGAGVSAPLTSSVTFANNDFENECIEQLSHALVDRRFEATQSFAMKMTSAGKVVFDTQADSVTLFYRQPEAFSNIENKEIIGLTTYSDFEIIQDLLVKKGMSLQSEVIKYYDAGAGLTEGKITLVEWVFA